MKPQPTIAPEAWDFQTTPMIAPTGFREYDARWRYPDQINLQGFTALGLGLGTQMHEAGIEPRIVVGSDFRSYSLEVRNAVTLGLVQAGIAVHDIGVALSPMAYFSQFHLGIPAVAMITASHNPNGWSGVKMGFQAPLTHGPDEMGRLRDIVLGGEGKLRAGGSYTRVDGVAEAYIRDLVGDFRLSRPLKVVCATGNGTASMFAPEVLRRIGCEVVALHNEPDCTFPHYNPNPEAMEMLHDMAHAVRASGADLALGFDGDGDRCGVVDNTGDEIFADKVGLIMAREWAADHPGAKFVVDVKSTGLFSSDPVLKAHGVTTDYWKTGHSHMKRRVHELGALAGFEKSGHYFLAGDIGRGYDCGLRVAVEMCKLLDRAAKPLSALKEALPLSYSTPTMSPFCADTEKYAVVERLVAKLCDMAKAGGSLGGRAISTVVTVNGARVMLENGAWALVRASSNTPNLVVVCESPDSPRELARIFLDLDRVIRTEPGVGDYDQTFDTSAAAA
ncbi:MAG: phosphomannomutase/phosphoglucomutase [Paracoccaceae bacterium]